MLMSGVSGTYPEPALAVLGLDGVGVAAPVPVPPPERGGVVNADGVNATTCQFEPFI